MSPVVELEAPGVETDVDTNTEFSVETDGTEEDRLGSDAYRPPELVEALGDASYELTHKESAYFDRVGGEYVKTVDGTVVHSVASREEVGAAQEQYMELMRDGVRVQCGTGEYEHLKSVSVFDHATGEIMTYFFERSVPHQETADETLPPPETPRETVVLDIDAALEALWQTLAPPDSVVRPAEWAELSQTQHAALAPHWRENPVPRETSSIDVSPLGSRASESTVVRALPERRRDGDGERRERSMRIPRDGKLETQSPRTYFKTVIASPSTPLGVNEAKQSSRVEIASPLDPELVVEGSSPRTRGLLAKTGTADSFEIGSPLQSARVDVRPMNIRSSDASSRATRAPTPHRPHHSNTTPDMASPLHSHDVPTPTIHENARTAVAVPHEGADNETIQPPTILSSDHPPFTGSHFSPEPPSVAQRPEPARGISGDHRPTSGQEHTATPVSPHVPVDADRSEPSVAHGSARATDTKEPDEVAARATPRVAPWRTHAPPAHTGLDLAHPADIAARPLPPLDQSLRRDEGARDLYVREHAAYPSNPPTHEDEKTAQPDAASHIHVAPGIERTSVDAVSLPPVHTPFLHEALRDRRTNTPPSERAHPSNVLTLDAKKSTVVSSEPRARSGISIPPPGHGRPRTAPAQPRARRRRGSAGTVSLIRGNP